jgi:hypothetical protein
VAGQPDTCACGKIRYTSKAAAKAAARQMRGRGKGGNRMRAYQCGGFWHLTSQSTTATTHFRERHR